MKSMNVMKSLNSVLLTVTLSSEHLHILTFYRLIVTRLWKSVFPDQHRYFFDREETNNFLFSALPLCYDNLSVFASNNIYKVWTKRVLLLVMSMNYLFFANIRKLVRSWTIVECMIVSVNIWVDANDLLRSWEMGRLSLEGWLVRCDESW